MPSDPMVQFICVSGSSGVGKSTFSRLLAATLSAEKCTSICGDDVHRWERGDINWEVFTHFDPSANNLELNHEHVRSLLAGKPVSRSHYNHDTGRFDVAVEVESREILVYEGLHALYHKPTYDLAQIRIYVDTDEELKNQWKTKRDIKKRGYKKSEVTSMISRRKTDEQKYIEPQKRNANVLVKFSRVEDKIEMNYVCLDSFGEELMSKIKHRYDKIATFISLCKKMSMDPSLYQVCGGNISVKDADGNIVITQSGRRLGNSSFFGGYCLFDSPSLDDTTNESEYFAILENAAKEGMPSMETGIHLTLPYKIVLHSHAVHANAILCSKEARGIIEDLFAEYNYSYVPYVTPGYDLYQQMCSMPPAPIVFLENHGIVVADDHPKAAFSTLQTIDQICKDWLYHQADLFVDGGLAKETGVLFPDAAIFPDKTKAVTEMLLNFMAQADLTPNFLKTADIERIKTSNFEIYRKSLQ